VTKRVPRVVVRSLDADESRVEVCKSLELLSRQAYLSIEVGGGAQSVCNAGPVPHRHNDATLKFAPKTVTQPGDDSTVQAFKRRPSHCHRDSSFGFHLINQQSPIASGPSPKVEHLTPVPPQCSAWRGKCLARDRAFLQAKNEAMTSSSFKR
jgi:hypothetical protein